MLPPQRHLQQATMLQPAVYLALALWAASADAFFAYCPAWHPGCDVAAGPTVESRAGPPPMSVPGVMTFEFGQRAEIVSFFFFFLNLWGQESHLYQQLADSYHLQTLLTVCSRCLVCFHF